MEKQHQVIIIDTCVDISAEETKKLEDIGFVVIRVSGTERPISVYPY